MSDGRGRASRLTASNKTHHPRDHEIGDEHTDDQRLEIQSEWQSHWYYTSPLLHTDIDATDADAPETATEKPQRH